MSDLSSGGGRLDVSSIEITPGGVFTKASSVEHRAVIDQLIPTIGANGKSGIADVKVMTGDPVVINGKRRGKDEHVDEVTFRQVAKSLGFGLRVDHTHMNDGRTSLRVQIQPKREFSAEAQASRKAKLQAARDAKKAERDREKRAAEMAAKAQAPVQKAAPKAQ